MAGLSNRIQSTSCIGRCLTASVTGAPAFAQDTVRPRASRSTRAGNTTDNGLGSATRRDGSSAARRNVLSVPLSISR